MPAKTSGKKTPMTFEQLAVENNFVTEEHLAECQKILTDEINVGKKVKGLADVLVRKEYMTRTQVRAVNLALERINRDLERDQTRKIGGYEILETIGEGSLGTVYKARQVSMGRIIALKVLHRKWLRDEEFQKRFLIEARLAGRLSHQNLIQVYDVGKDGDSLYFSMEYVDGETVEDILNREGPMDIDRAIDITLQITRAIALISRYGVVHRDIKPGNIMLTLNDLAKLGDFGFVKTNLDRHLTVDGEVLGTPDYIAPEQAMAEPVDFKADIYGLGASLYHMLAGDPPFSGTGSDKMKKHVMEDLPPLRELRPEIPRNVIGIVEKMMAKDPEERYQNFIDLFNDLELLKAGLAPQLGEEEAGGTGMFKALKTEKIRLAKLERERNKLTNEVKAMAGSLATLKYLTLFLLLLVAVLLVLLFIVR